MFFYAIILSFFSNAHAVSNSYNIPVTVACPTGSATQTGNNFTCSGSPPIPQCPSPPGTGPCNPPTPGNCTGFTNTIHLSMNWANPVRIFAPTMGVNDAVVVQFTSGSFSSPNNNLPRFAAAEYLSSPSARIATLSATACDFGTPTWPGGKVSGNSVTIPFAVGIGSNFGYYPIVPLNTTWYFNIKNDLTSTPACQDSGNCGIAIDLTKPGGI